MILGPKSRAGLIAYPVVPPKLKPIAMIKKPTTTGCNPPVNSLIPTKRIANIKIAVPIISEITLLG